MGQKRPKSVKNKQKRSEKTPNARKCKHYLTVPFSVHSSTKEDSSVMYVLADAELIPDSSLILDPSSNVVDPNQMDDK